MEVKSGYKLTELGIIPDDWNVLQLSKHFQIYAGGDVPKHSLSKSRSETYPYPIYANALKEKGLYGFTGEWRGKAGSLTITARGNLGHAEYREEDFFPIVRLLVLEPTGILDARFTTFAINERVKFALESTGVPQLTSPQVKKYSVAAPALLSEQRAIALTLNDVDALLDQLNKLISKKRYLKQAAMQQLLTGKIRLPGFNKEWKIKTLNQIISRFSTGLNPRKNFSLNSGGNFYYVTIKNFTTGRLLLNEKCDLIDKTAFLKINERSDLRKDDILFSSIGRIGDAYLITENPQNWNINESVFTLRPDKKQIIPLMLFHLLRSTKIKDALNQGATGSTFTSIKQAQLKKISCYIPTSKDEQIAIAETISEMDNELTLLEKQHNKIKSLKQAMMQELLTGKTRLV